MNNVLPSISIITVNYNDGAGLEKTIGSVISQEYFEIEHLVIDGGSTDHSTRIIQEHSDHLAYWISEPDGGIYQAMNKGIKKATHDYVLFLNSGDELSSDRSIQLLAEVGREDFIYGNVIIREGNRNWIKNYPSELTFSYFLKESLPHPCTLIKRSLFERFGLYNEQFKIVSDWEFFINAICKYNASYRHVNQPISIFNLDGMSSKIETQELIWQERNEVLKKQFSSFLPDYNKHMEVENSLNLLTNSRFNKIMNKIRGSGIYKTINKK